MTFSTSFRCYVVLGSTFEANFKEKPSLLGYLFFCGISNGHLLSLKEGLISSFLLAEGQIIVTLSKQICPSKLNYPTLNSGEVLEAPKLLDFP